MLRNNGPIPAVEEVVNRLALRFETKPGFALPLGRDAEIRDEFALSHDPNLLHFSHPTMSKM
jgi:hypothetical protein